MSPRLGAVRPVEARRHGLLLLLLLLLHLGAISPVEARRHGLLPDEGRVLARWARGEGGVARELCGLGLGVRSRGWG